MMLRVPLAAPSGPPETGASRKETPAAVEAACSSLANSTLTCMRAVHVDSVHDGAAREMHVCAHAVQVQVHMRAQLTVPASMRSEPGAATSSSPPRPRKTDRSAASPATDTTTVEARLHSSSRLHGWVEGQSQGLGSRLRLRQRQR